MVQVENLLITGTNTVATANGCPIHAQTVTLANGAVLTHLAATSSQTYSLQLTVTSNLVVDAASRIDVSGSGYLPGKTLGNTSTGGASGLSGGSYGGLGAAVSANLGVGVPNTAYGDYHNPNELGSGGAGGTPGVGGGLVRITAGSAQINGAILANGGGGGYYGGGGGSGGGILLNVGTLSGVGTIAANGGGGGNDQQGGGGGGGGGRVAVYTWKAMSLSSNNVTAIGNSQGGVGAAGSVYISGTPFFAWTQPPALLHGTEQIACYVLGVDPSLLTVELVGSYAGVNYLDAVVAGATGVFNWNTTLSPDNPYALQAIFRNGASQIIGRVSQNALVNNSVMWHGGTLAANENWGSNTVHVIEQAVIIPNGVTLTIQPGAIVKFVKGTGITVQDDGVLNALATPSAPIIFTALSDDTAGGDTNLDGDNFQPQPGDWSGIGLQGTGQFKQTANVDIRYLIMSIGGTLAGDQSLMGTYVYIATNNVVVPGGRKLTINPGAVIKFASGVGLVVSNGGVLSAQGTVAQPITFTSLKDDSVGGDSNGDGNGTLPGPGDWVGLNISGPAAFNHCRIRYGGDTGSGGGASGIIIIQSDTTTISNSVIESALWDGVSASGGACLIANSVLRDLDRAVWACSASIHLINSTLDENLVAISAHCGPIQAENCIIANSIQTSAEGGTVRYCNIWSKYTNSVNPIAIGSNGNISADPKFKNAAQGDYRLNYGSPCIDAADTTVAPLADAMGAPRYNDPRTLVKTGIATNGVSADMGAFEFVENAASPIDLIVTAVTGPDTVIAGQTGTVQWTVANIGTGPATGPWHDTIALMSMTGIGDPLFADEVLVGQGIVLGPGESTSISAVVRIPGGTAGNYRWQVRCNSRGEVFEGANWINNTGLAAMPSSLSEPLLTVGGLTLTNSFTSTSQPYWFMFTTQTNEDIQVSLSLAGGGGALGLYIGQGFMPTTENFTFQQTQWNSPAVTAVVANPSTQPYYVLVGPVALSNTPSSFTIAASTPSFALSSVSPSVVGNSGAATLLISGSHLTGDMTYQVVDSLGVPHSATGVSVLNSSEVYANFNFTGLPTGTYTVQVVGQAAVLPGALNVISGAAGHVELHIIAPQFARVGRVVQLAIEYTNTGSSDVAAPIVFVRGNFRTYEFRQQGQSAWIYGQYQFLAINQDGPAGVLPPGYHGRIQLEVNDFETGGVPVELVASLVYPENTVDWASLKTMLKPEYQPSDSWNVIYAKFLAKAGTTYGQLQDLLAADATHLSQLGNWVSDVRQLLSFELQQAGNNGAITRRYRIGAFGRGLPDPAGPTSVEESSSVTNKSATVLYSGNVRRFHFSDSASSATGTVVYLGEPGDFATLTKTTSHWVLHEKNGFNTYFLIWNFFGERNRLDYTQDPNGNRVQANYDIPAGIDLRGQVIGQTDSFGDTVSYTYNNYSRITQVTDAVGRATTYTYDASYEHVLQISNAVGVTHLNWVTGQGGAREHALSSIAHSDGTHTYFTYDSEGRLTRQTSDGGAEPITYAYDAFGGVTTTDALGVKSATVPNEFGKVTGTSDSLGVTSQIEYDKDRNPTRIQNSAGIETAMTYDTMGNATSITDPMGGQVGMAYESTYNQPTLVVDPLGHGLGMQYDVKGNNIATVFADGTRQQSGYDAAGNVTAWTNRRGHTFHYTYDAHNLLTAKILPDGSTQTYGYDAHRNLTSVSNVTGVISYIYNPSDRMTQVVYPTGRFLQFSYNAGGRRAQMVDQDGFTTRYSYDSLGRLALLSDGSGHTNVAYSYDSVGRLAGKVLGNANTTAYAYFTNGLLRTIVNQTAIGGVLSRFDYGYDSLGRITSMTTLAGNFTYAYDANSQLTSVHAPGGRSITYQYDAAGNRTAVVDNGTNTIYIANGLNQYLTAGVASFSYDADGNLVTKTDASGTTAYTYDDENRLVSLVSSSGSWNYEYDALGQRTAVTKNGQRREYLLDPAGLVNVVGEYQGGGLVAHYTHGLGLASRVDAGGAATYYDFDANGNTADLTDSSGALLNRYSYLPFGEKLSATGATSNSFTYVGQYGVTDGGEGAYFMRNRWYDPSTGRFPQSDPTGLQGGDVNLYRYVVNSPTQRNDPIGTGAMPMGGTTGGGVRMPNPVWERDPVNPDIYFVHDIQFIHPGTLREGSINVTRRVDINNPETWNRIPGDPPPDNVTPSSDPQEGIPPADPQNNYYARIRRLASGDPNDKIGSGFGTQGFVTGNGNLFFTIDFENVPTATAAAQQVVVTDQLDRNLDWSTLELQTIAFNNVTINVPAGRQNYSTQTSVTTDPNPVKVEAAFNPTSGVLTWTMTSIDPVTGRLVTDPLAGFLPPDTTNSIGQGSVTYIVRPKGGLANNTLITNQASIVFDVNAAILTPIVTNTIDRVAPQSAVQALPAAESSTQFTIRWSGSDTNGSGVQNYAVYVSTNGIAYMPWLLSTTNTSGIFTGQVGKTYAFYSVVTDNVGNQEAVPVTADTTTTVSQAACTFALAASNTNVLAGVGSGSVGLTTLTGCVWSATSSTNWIQTTSSGTGPGTVSYTVDANPAGIARSGTITVNGQTFTINQVAATCTYALAASSTNVLADVASGSVGLATLTGCVWSATSSTNWIQTTSSGTGPGTVSYTVDVNLAGLARSGTITVNGQTFTINQVAATCTYALAASSTNVLAGVASGSVGLTTLTGCVWNATSSTNWIQTTSSGTGPGTVSYTVDANPAGIARSGTIVVNGQMFTVNQAAFQLTQISVQANPTNAGTVSGAGAYLVGTNVLLTASAGQAWRFTGWSDGATSSMRTITVPATNTTYTAQFQPSTATITVIAALTNAGTVSGGGLCSVGTNVTIQATPKTGYTFVNWTEGGNPVSSLASYTFTVSGDRTLTAHFVGLAIATTSPLPLAAVGHTYNQVFQATGGFPPYKWSVISGRLPAGLKLNAVSGALSGTPTVVGTNNFRIGVADSIKQSVSNDFVLVVRDLFGPLAGTYTGLLIQTNAPTHASSGLIQIVLAKTGSFAGNLTRAGGKTAFAGQFDLAGNATNPVAGASVALHMDLAGGSGPITGVVTGNGFVSELLAERPDATRTWQGTYTLLLSATDTNAPQGYGYATLTVNRTGSGSLSGVLNDGAKLTAKAPVSQSGLWPLYVSLYKTGRINAGACVGWVSFETNTTVTATVDWFAPTFATALTLAGSQYTTGPQLTNGIWAVNLSGGGLPSNIVQAVTLNVLGKVIGANPLKLKITLNSGQFSGSFNPAIGAKPIAFNGLLLQVQDLGAGLFQTTTGQTGGITLEPVP